MRVIFETGLILRLSSVSIEKRLNQIGSISFEVIYNIIPDNIDLRDLYLKRFSIQYQNVTVVSGYLNAIPKIEYTLMQGLETVSFEGFDELGYLSFLRGNTDAVYEDKSIEYILNDLVPDGWSINTGTLQAGLDTITVDLRDKQILSSQILESVTTLPNVFIRYGGMVSGNNVIEVGLLNEKNYSLQIGNHNLSDIQIDIKNPDQIYMIEAYGGFSLEDTEIISLRDAVEDNPLLLSDSQYPVRILDDGKYVVVNMELYPDKGKEVSMKFETIKPDNLNTEQTPEDRRIAGRTIYNKAVQLFEQNRISEQIYIITVPLKSTSVIESLSVGQQVFVNINTHTLVDTYSESIRRRNIISGWFRITSLEYVFGMDEYPELVIEINSNEQSYPVQNSGSVALYDAASTKNSFDSKSIIVNNIENNNQYYPSEFNIFGYMMESNVDIATVVENLQPFNFYVRQDSPLSSAVGNELTFSAQLRSGQYKGYIWACKDDDGGFANFYCNGVNILTNQNLYSASFTGAVLLETNTFTVNTGGEQQFRILMTGKQAASSGYVFYITNFAIKRIGDV